MMIDKWVENGVEEGLLRAFRKAIVGFPKDRRIAIWGASVRGTILGCMLEMMEVYDFDYVDNDISKCGQFIANHRIMGVEDVQIWNREEHFIVIPIEYGIDIVNQLKQLGYIENRDFVFIKTDIEDKYVEELTKKRDVDTLIFGDSQLVVTTIGETNKECLQTVLESCFNCTKTSFLSIGCLSLGHIYEFTRLSKTYFAQGLKQIYIFLTYEMLSPWHYYLSRTRHTGLLHRIFDVLMVNDDEYEDYMRMADVRASNYLIEKRYSPVRTSNQVDVDGKKTRNDYALLVYGRKISYYDVPLTYLHRILCYCKENDIICRVINYPVNMDELLRIDPDLRLLVKKNNNKIKNEVESCGGRWTDLSDFLDEEDFVIGATIGCGVRKTGMNKILSRIEEIVSWNQMD